MENIWVFYLSMPPVTRVYITACVLTTLGVQLDLISPFQLYFNFGLIFYGHQFWRLITTFLFFGTLSFSFFFNILFLSRYSRMLEEGSFRSNSADFFFMLLFGAVLMILVAPFVKLLFLGHAFTIMLVYLWSKRNPAVQLSLFGLFNFRAPHLPWILLAFSLILGNSVLTDVLGISIGHIYYYLQDVFPYLPGGFRILKTPRIIVYLFNPGQYYLDRLDAQVTSINATANTENAQSGQASPAANQANGEATNRESAASNVGASRADGNAEGNAASSTASHGISATNESKENQELRNRVEKSDKSDKSDDKLSDKQAEKPTQSTDQPTSQPAANLEKKESSSPTASEQRPPHEHLE